MSSPMFRTLDPSTESRKRRGVTFICGLCAQTLLVGAAILFGLMFPEQLPVSAKQYVLVWLTPPPDVVLKPQPKVARVVVPKLKPPEAPARPAPTVARLEVPDIPRTISPVPARVPELPTPAAPVAPPRPTPKVLQITVHTGTFGGAVEKVTTKRPVEQVQTGGFGSPQGLPGRAQADSLGNVPILGSFGLPDGPGLGNGTGGRHGVQGVVTSVGFGSSIAGPGHGGGGGGIEGSKVMMGGFEKVAQIGDSPLKRPHAIPRTEFQPVEILFKPSPVYTEEARRMGIQGEVALSVIFQANGAIRIIGVARSLGHGLDQAAVQAATQIRFKPALRDGQPADFPATLRIEFRLADQSI